jgi:hypothetical protein
MAYGIWHMAYGIWPYLAHVMAGDGLALAVCAVQLESSHLSLILVVHALHARMVDAEMVDAEMLGARSLGFVRSAVRLNVRSLDVSSSDRREIWQRWTILCATRRRSAHVWLTARGNEYKCLYSPEQLQLQKASRCHTVLLRLPKSWLL